jgi:hypothetical protein
LVHAIIVAIAIAIGVIVALSARPTRSHQALPRGAEVSAANFSD